MENPVPSLHEEIVRKTYETIEKITTDRTRGRITNAQFSYGVDVLWSAVAGLVDSDFVVAMEMLGADKRPVTTKLVFLSDDGLTVVRIINDHQSTVTYTAFKAGESATNRVFDYKDEINPLEQISKTVRALAATLHKKGFSLL